MAKPDLGCSVLGLLVTEPAPASGSLSIRWEQNYLGRRFQNETLSMRGLVHSRFSAAICFRVPTSREAESHRS